MKRTLCFFILASLTFAAQAQIYKWTDSQGNVHFTDKPHKGAVQVDLPEVQTYSPPAVSQSNGDSAQDDDTADSDYEQVTILQPENEATIRNNQGLINVTVKLEPQLKAGDKLQMIFDGNKLGDPQTVPNFILNNVYRGEHTIAIQVQDTEGNVVTTSDSITVFMHRPRVGMVPGTKPNTAAKKLHAPASH